MDKSNIQINTADIPQHVSNYLCDGLLSAIKAYMKKPGAKEELEARGKAYYERKAAREATEKQLAAKEN